MQPLHFPNEGLIEFFLDWLKHMVLPGVKGLHNGCKEIHGGQFSSFLRLFLIGSRIVKLKHRLSIYEYCIFMIS